MKFNAESIRKSNDKDRMLFVKKWAHYVKTHPDKIWSKQQNILINSQIDNARHARLTPNEYLRIKGELK